MKLKYLFILIGLLAFAKSANSQQSSSTQFNHQLIHDRTEKIFEKLVKLRRSIHEHPELAGSEKETQETIKQYLLNLGLEVQTDIYGYGLVGILKGGKKGKSIAWRADMDALPNSFRDNVDFKSVIAGVQHGCGHDVHISIALGIAEVLAMDKANLRGTVYFIFQPEEESFKGAKGMVDSKPMAGIKLQEIYGLHITPFPLGQIMVKPHEMYAYQKGVRIHFKNQLPKEKIEILTASLRSTLTRTSNHSRPWELQHALDPNQGLANSNTIFKDYFLMDELRGSVQSDGFFLEGDVYETNKKKIKDIIPAIKRVIANVGLSEQLIAVTFFKENPTIQNNPQLTAETIQTLDGIYGKGTVTVDYGQVPFSNDDFAYFQQKTPGVYFFLGGSNFEKGMIAMIHAPNFMVDEESIRIGVEKFSALLYSRLSE